MTNSGSVLMGNAIWLYINNDWQLATREHGLTSFVVIETTKGKYVEMPSGDILPYATSEPTAKPTHQPEPFNFSTP